MAAASAKANPHSGHKKHTKNYCDENDQNSEGKGFNVHFN
jgi:hypothetical protein